MPTALPDVRRHAHRVWQGIRSASLRQWDRSSNIIGPQSGPQPPPPWAFASFGRDTWIVPPARVAGADRIRVGDRVIILEHAILDAGDRGKIMVGDRVRLARGVNIRSSRSVELREAVSTSDHVAITDTWDVDIGQEPGDTASVLIDEGAYLGFGSFIGPGVIVGAGAYVGEGAVVLEDVPPHTVVYGNPARIIRRLDPQNGRWSSPRFR